MNPEELKTKAIEEINSLQEQLMQVRTSLYENPETAFEEFKSAKLLSGILEDWGFEVERGIGTLDTAFKASRSGKPGGPSVAILAEYDALPKIGHACGHNLIASAALGAGGGLIPFMEHITGDLFVFGTPAEEGGGGKQILADAGVFEGLDAAMMIHPSSRNMVRRGSLASMRLHVEYFGKPSHAAASPQEGINALDAMLILFNSIHAMRQHFEPKDRVAGIILHGGDAANVIPAYTRAEFSIRGEDEKRRQVVLDRVIACAEAAALATRCQVKFDIKPGYAEIAPNKIISEAFALNVKKLGREMALPQPVQPMGSTDMGNVSQVVPSIHPYLATVPENVGGHTEEYREICMTDSGKSTVMDGAKAMAMTALDLFSSPEMVEQARKELQDYQSRKR